MNEKFFRKENHPEYRNLHKLRGMNLKQVIQYFEGDEMAFEKFSQPKILGKKEDSPEKPKNSIEEGSLFDGFLEKLRSKQVRVSTPEWLQFLKVLQTVTTVKELKNLLESKELLYKLRLYAMTTLLKDKADEARFHEAFDEYFSQNPEEEEVKIEEEQKDTLNEKMSEDKAGEDSSKKQEAAKTNESDSSEKKEEENNKQNEKDPLGTQDTSEAVKPQTGHTGEETVHGGKEDQHNDILRREDKKKLGGGNMKPVNKGGIQQEVTEEGIMLGHGQGKSHESIIVESSFKNSVKDIEKRKEEARLNDRRSKHEKRPDRQTMKEVVRNLRKIIMDVSQVKSRDVNIRESVGNFARKKFSFEYDREREKQPEVVLLIDVGGPVDQWSPLIEEISQEMAKGLTKLEMYTFHNIPSGILWKAEDRQDPTTAIELKKIIKRRKKVIIYGDANMAGMEFNLGDGYIHVFHLAPKKMIESSMIGGKECITWIKKHSDSVVWVNPIFKKEWQEDGSETIGEIGKIIPMYDLTIGGVQDAIKKLVEK